MTTEFLTPIEIRAGSTETHCLDLTPWLSGEATAISSLTSLLEVDTTALTITNKAKLTSEFTERDGLTSVAANKGVKATFYATAPGTYYVELKCVLNDSESTPVLRQKVVVK